MLGKMARSKGLGLADILAGPDARHLNCASRHSDPRQRGDSGDTALSNSPWVSLTTSGSEAKDPEGSFVLSGPVRIRGALLVGREPR